MQEAISFSTELLLKEKKCVTHEAFNTPKISVKSESEQTHIGHPDYKQSCKMVLQKGK